MAIFFYLISTLLGLYFLRWNLIFSILLTTIFFIIIIFKLRSKKILICVLSFSLGVIVPIIKNNVTNNDYIHVGYVIDAKENYFLFQSKFEKYYVYEKDNKHEIFEKLEIRSNKEEIKFTTYESQFNFSDYLKNKGVKYSLSNKNIITLSPSLFSLRKHKDNFLSNYNDDTKDIVASLLFNERNYENETILISKEMNLIYLFSLSGIYLSVFISALKKFLSLFLNDKIAEFTSIFLFVPLSIFLFPKFSIIRILCLKTLKAINYHVLKKKFSNLEIVSFLAILFLLIDFNLAYQEGYYIGFCLSILFVFIAPLITKVKGFKKAILFPFIVYIFMLPLSSFQNGYIELLSFIFQILLLPINEIYLAFAIFGFYLNIPFNNLMSFLTNIINDIYYGLSFISIKINISYLSIYFAPLYYFLLIAIFYLLESKRINHLKIIASSLIFMLVLFCVPITSLYKDAIYFINVGQGDSILFQNKNNIVLLDTGGVKNNDLAKNSLIPFFRKHHISHIDYLLLTHDDFDHCGASNSLIANFPVYNVYNNKNFKDFTIGDLTFNNLNNYSFDNDNDNSLVFNVSFIGKKFLFMGDASIEVEKRLINDKKDIDCDILKVGHHGSKTSTCEQFIKETSPKEAVISSGRNNYYGHPSSEVINLLNKYEINIRLTSYEGTIIYQ